MEGASYRVKLENFYGPLDLLLHLIRKKEIPVDEIRVHPIAEQYKAYLQEIQKLDVDVASEFVVVAATLMRMKSRSLLPDKKNIEDLEEETEFEDPGAKLIQNLLRYRTFKDRADLLRDRRDRERKRYPAPGEEDDFQNVEDETEFVDLSQWKLVRSYVDITEELQMQMSTKIIYDEIPQEIIIDDILETVDREKDVSFAELIGRDVSRTQAVSYFMGMLNLAKDQKLHVRQDSDSSQIRVTKKEENNERHEHS